MIDAMIYNLEKGLVLLSRIDQIQYCDNSVAPYYSSIGGHIRHILDIYDCVFCGIDSGHIDLCARPRDLEIETNLENGINYFNQIIEKLKNIEINQPGKLIKLTDDLGLGKITADYTIAAALIQAHSHAIHHFAALGYVLNNLGIDLPDDDFGFNPTTPRKTARENCLS